MIQKSIPILLNIKPPNSSAAKKILRLILSSGTIQPLRPDEIKELLKHRKTRKRVFLSEKKDEDLIRFFNTAPRSLQYAVFYEFNKKVKEVNL